MKKLSKPTESTSDVIALCAISIESDDLRNRLNSVAPHIGQEEAIYEQRGESKSLFQIASSVNVAGVVTCDEMKKIYKSPFTRGGSRARAIYDRLRGQPRHGKCPLCAHRDVSTLDHYLAKSTHPTFVLTPLNLVPSCASCNKTKLDFVPLTPVDQTFHPYYDDVDGDVWLHAEVLETSPPAVRFFARPSRDQTMPPDTCRRIENHFSRFRLANLYGSNAAQELTQIRHGLCRIRESQGITGVRQHLQDQAESRSACEKNSWQSALYVALHSSEWFCDVGHALAE